MRITIYIQKDCLPCLATRRAMERRGFEFDMINVADHPEAADMLRTRGFCHLPVVMVGEMSWSGFRPDMINRLRHSSRLVSA